MTFCLGIKVREGLIGIADTRVTTGNEVIQARKATVHQHDARSFFLMTSGLRSVRDKVLTYFEELLSEPDTKYDRLYKAVNGFATQIRRVAEEDRNFLEASDLAFNLYGLIGGQLRADGEPKLYLIYPQGNWVEIGPGTPYSIIGESGYGKPILDRTLKYEDPVRYALKVGCLAFDSTRISSATVDFPIDVVVYRGPDQSILQHRYNKDDMRELSNLWQETLRTAVCQLPSDWLDDTFGASDDPETFPMNTSAEASS